MIKTLLAPIRAVTRFPLVQFAAVILVIFLLQAAEDNSFFGQIFDGLDKLVDESVRSVSAVFTVKSFTKSWLTFGFMIAYVYLALWLVLSICGAVLRSLVDFAGRKNFLWSRNPIARSRGIAAYRAWLPLEELGRSIFLSGLGKSNSPGRRTIGRHICHWGSASCEHRQHIRASFCSLSLFSSSSHHST